MPILPEEVKKTQPKTNKKNPTTSTYLRYFICSKKPDLGLKDRKDVTRAGWMVLGSGLQAGESMCGKGQKKRGDRMRPPEQELTSWSH